MATKNPIIIFNTIGTAHVVTQGMILQAPLPNMELSSQLHSDGRI
jgi:hypothetical protein